jgi:hypothetical protein
MLSHTSWQEVDHQLGELWDLENILDVAEHVEATADLTREKRGDDNNGTHLDNQY